MEGEIRMSIRLSRKSNGFVGWLGTYNPTKINP